MKSINALNSWEKRQEEKYKRLRRLGWILMFISLLGAGFAFMSETSTIKDWVVVTIQEREGYYMMSVVFAVMSLLCLSSLWQK